jgi:hypothetical protein
MATTKDLTGTYGQSGNDATTDDITGIIRKNSYCAGTRDDPLVIETTETQVSRNSSFIYSIQAPANTVIDGVLEVPGQPSVKVSALSKYDPIELVYSANIEVYTGSAIGQVNLKIVSFNNYPLFQDAQSVEVIDFDPGTSPDPGIYVYIDKYEEEIGTNFTGSITLTNLVIGQSYSVNFINLLTEEVITGISSVLDESSLIATSETMVIPFSVPSSIFTNLETLITASIFSNILPPPPNEA